MLPAATVTHFPVVVSLVGALVTSAATPSAKPFEETRAYERATSLMAECDNKGRWHLLNAIVAVVHTLRDTFGEVTDGVLFSFREEDALRGVPAEMLPLGRVILDWLSVESGRRPATVGAFRRGEVDLESYALALAITTSCAAVIVYALADLLETPPDQTWKTIRPMLLN